MGKHQNEEGVYWFKKSAEQGYMHGEFNLGLHYYNNKNYTEAVPWFKKAAEQGNVSAMEKLSACYRYGRGVEKDIKQAEFWANKAKQVPNVP